MSIAVFAALVAARAGGAQGRVIRGVVTDTLDKPVASVSIQLQGARAIATDDSGRFRLQLPHRDRIAFDLRRVGFLPSRFGVREGGDTDVVIVLLPVAQQLEAVKVSATEVDRALERSGFNERMRARDRGTTSGYFVTAAEIERRNPPRFSQMFDEFPGIKLCRTSKGTVCGLFGTQFVPNPNTGPRAPKYIPCSITIYLDGARIQPEVSTGVVDLDAIALPSSIAGFEYYPSGNRIPNQYQLLNGSCGLVLIWTKRG